MEKKKQEGLTRDEAMAAAEEKLAKGFREDEDALVTCDFVAFEVPLGVEGYRKDDAGTWHYVGTYKSMAKFQTRLQRIAQAETPKEGPEGYFPGKVGMTCKAEDPFSDELRCELRARTNRG